MWDNFGSWEADASYNVPAVPEDAQTNVLQGVEAPPVGSDAWTGFFQESVKGLLGYATAKDAAKTRADLGRQQMQAQYSQTQAYRQAAYQSQGLGGLLPLLLIGGVVFLIAKD